MAIFESDSSSMRESVVLPAPEGEDSTSIRPRRAIAAPSLDILHLLAHLLDGALQVDADARELDVGRFRAQRIGLAIELLAEEIELAAHRLVAPGARQQIARLRDMRLEPVEFLAHVGLADQQRHFLRQPLLAQRRGAAQ